MIKLKIVAIGSIKEQYLKDAISEYSKRISPFAKLQIVELTEGNSALPTIEKIKNAEAQKIKENISGCIVVLDSKGDQMDSVQFAEFIDAKAVQGISQITFIIGGSYGLDSSIIENANFVLSFSKMTFPHQLMRVILLEQIYRAETILNNIKYHK